MKKYVHTIIAILSIGLCARSEVVTYRFAMTLYVPRVYDNMQSLGYRRNQLQKIVGYITVDKSLQGEETEPRIYAWSLVNNTHKVQKAKVTYHDAEAADVMWRYIGNNRTGVFRNTQIKFSLDLDPSYNIGADEADNTLMIQLAGRGATERSIKGAVTGQIGCGCTAYGHISPTRTVGCLVSDITPLYGSFTMTMNRIGAVTCR